MKNNNVIEARLFGGHQPARVIIALVLILGLLFVALSIAWAASNRAPANGLPVGLTTIFEEDFESALGPSWTISDLDGAVSGEYYWSRTDQAANGGTFSAWATGGGAEGALLQPGVDDYPNSSASVMVHDPVDLSVYNGARLSFDVWYKTQSTFDVLEVGASTDGLNYSSLAVYSGDSGGWLSKELDLSAYAGQTSVYVRFYFSSNAASTDKGVFLDNIRLEGTRTYYSYVPLSRLDPTPEPPIFYFDDFSDPTSGWPEVDNTWNPSDCFKWFYFATEETYRNDICDDRTDVKVSPGVNLPTGDYVIEMDGRFRMKSQMWWTSYGILFDAKDDPNPSNPDLGDYYMLWVLWEGSAKHKVKILKDVPGNQFDVTPWMVLDGNYYDYGNEGTNFNHWRIERTASRIRVYVNDTKIIDVGESRPTTNNQVLFGVFSSTYETTFMKAAYDNFLVDLLNPDTPADRPYWSSSGEPTSIVVSGEFDLERFLPQSGPLD